MHIIFSRNSSPVSYLIRKITGECVSHTGIRIGEYIIHSNFCGIQIDRTVDFLKHSQIILQVEVANNYPRLFNLVCKYYKAKYDFGAMAYLALRLLLPRFMSKQNLWQSSGMFLCTEWVSKYLDGKEDHLVTPYKLYLKLINNKEKLV